MRFIFLHLILIFHIPLFAQSQNFTITGKVTDENSAPLVSASVRSLRTAAGTVTNSTGAFSLNIKNLPGDTLSISYLGFESYKISLDNIGAAGNLIIRMKANSGLMKEIVVKTIDPVLLIQSAIEKIPFNYFTIPLTSSGFYRMITRKGEKNIILSEAAFDIYNYGYTSKKDNVFRLIKSRHIQDDAACKGWDMELKPKELFGFDLIKELSQSDLFSKSGLKNHVFKLNGIVEYNGAEAYKISFDQRDGVKESLYKGKLYIEVNSLAIIAIEQTRSNKGIAYAKYGNGAQRAFLKLMGVNIGIKKDDLWVTYQKYGNKWMLANVRNNNILDFKSERLFYDFPADVKIDYVITGVDTTVFDAVSGKGISGNNKMMEFEKSIGEKYFWKDNTIILPDYNPDSVAKQIIDRNELYNLKTQVKSLLKDFPKERSAKIDAILNFYHQKAAFNGSVLIKHKGKIILQKGYGYADKEKKWPAADTTQYRIGSLTKTFTAMLIQQLVSDNKLSLQDTIGKFLPAYIHSKVTIAQLLTHTSGIPSYTNDPASNVMIMSKEIELKDLLSRLCSDPLEFESGTQFHYSNSGYTILAAILEAVTNKKFAILLEEKIFLPLQMGQSVFGMQPQNSKGYLWDKPEPLYALKNMIGAGGIISTVNDLLKWDEVLYTDKLISLTQLQESFTPKAAYDDWDADYGFGWMIDRKLFRQSGKHTFIYHPGTDMGYYSMFVRQPDENNLVIMLSNSGDFPRFDITDLVLDELN